MSFASQIESILFLATKPLTLRDLVKATAAPTEKDVLDAIEQLRLKYEQPESGVRLVIHENLFQFMTAPENTELVEKVFHQELSGELTKPALETLTIIAYRGPITKPELELIRGINCSMILRNLMMRGLVIEQAGDDEFSAKYIVSPEFLQFLGMTNVKELPEFDALHSHELLQALLDKRTQAS